MPFDLTITHFLLGGFAFVLILIFALAAFLDNRQGKAALRRDFRREGEFDLPAESIGHDDEDDTSFLHTHFADLSASGLGTAGQNIIFRDKSGQYLEEDRYLPASRAN